jgi:hypothetical protein
VVSSLGACLAGWARARVDGAIGATARVGARVASSLCGAVRVGGLDFGAAACRVGAAPCCLASPALLVVVCAGLIVCVLGRVVLRAGDLLGSGLLWCWASVCMSTRGSLAGLRGALRGLGAASSLGLGVKCAELAASSRALFGSAASASAAYSCTRRTVAVWASGAIGAGLRVDSSARRIVAIGMAWCAAVVAGASAGRMGAGQLGTLWPSASRRSGALGTRRHSS